MVETVLGDLVDGWLQEVLVVPVAETRWTLANKM